MPEAAQGIEELKAGVSTSDILNGGLRALDLAASGNISVAEAAQSLLRRRPDPVQARRGPPSHIADPFLAAAAGKAQGGARNVAGPEPGRLDQTGAGLSIEETVGTLAAFASAGLPRQRRKTSLTMLQSCKTRRSSRRSSACCSDCTCTTRQEHRRNGEPAGQLKENLRDDGAARRALAQLALTRQARRQRALPARRRASRSGRRKSTSRGTRRSRWHPYGQPWARGGIDSRARDLAWRFFRRHDSREALTSLVNASNSLRPGQDDDRRYRRLRLRARWRSAHSRRSRPARHS